MLESALLRTHFDVIPFGIYVVDVTSLELVFVNKLFRERMGEAVSGKCYEVIYANDRPCPHCRIAELLTPQGMPNGKTVIYDQYNEHDERWCQLQEKTMGWPDGRVVKYSIAVDISELKETQNRLAEAHAALALRNRELADQNRILQENIHLREHVERIAKHDLKAPLSALIGLPRLLLDNYDLPDEAAHMVRLIEQAGQNMLEMLNQSLILYKLETDTYALASEPLDLLELVREVVGRLVGSSLGQMRRVRVSLDGREPRPGERLVFPGDPLLCRPLLQNLLQNALEATPIGGEVCVDVRSGQDSVAVALSNPGEVPEAIRGRMFEKYVTQGKRGGTGLGAYSAALAVRAHGGRVQLDASRPGATTVLVTLPTGQDAGL
ncbi:MAG: ATP-binding protein [Desulfovibrionaceae bacterium]